MKKLLYLIAALLVIAVLTNPSKEDHKNVAKEALTAVATKTMSSNLKGNMFAGLAMLAVPMMVDTALSQVTYKNYILFSKYSGGYGGKTLYYGVFGQIIPTEFLRELDFEKIKAEKDWNNFIDEQLTADSVKVKKSPVIESPTSSVRIEKTHKNSWTLKGQTTLDCKAFTVVLFDKDGIFIDKFSMYNDFGTFEYSADPERFRGIEKGSWTWKIKCS